MKNKEKKDRIEKIELQILSIYKSLKLQDEVNSAMLNFANQITNYLKNKNDK